MNRQQKSRQDCQSFFHSFDYYAKPVTLTYNQQKQFKTVLGGICSIFSFFILGLYISSNFLKYADPKYVTYTHSSTQVLNSQIEPPLYELGID